MWRRNNSKMVYLGMCLIFTLYIVFMPENIKWHSQLYNFCLMMFGYFAGRLAEGKYKEEQELIAEKSISSNSKREDIKWGKNY